MCQDPRPTNGSSTLDDTKCLVLDFLGHKPVAEALITVIYVEHSTIYPTELSQFRQPFIKSIGDFFMRKILLTLALFPALVLANPPGLGQPPVGDGPQHGKHHQAGHEHGENFLPRFLHDIELTDKQRTDIKTLIKTHHEQLAAKGDASKEIHKEIQRLIFSKDFNEDKLLPLLDQAAESHKKNILENANLDNAVFKLLTPEQQQKLQSKVAELAH
jgi:Spy/CpxP family protein refolding chaperone